MDNPQQYKARSKLLEVLERRQTALAIKSRPRKLFIALSIKNKVKRLSKPPLTSWSGNAWRAVPQSIKTDKGMITNNEATVFNWHPGIKWANGRYSKPGIEAMYTSIGAKVQAWETVMEELGMTSHEPLILHSMEFKFSRVLDLTDKRTLQHIELTTRDLIINFHDNPNAYCLTHKIEEIAQSLGIEALIVESAASRNGIKIVILKR